MSTDKKTALLQRGTSQFRQILEQSGGTLSQEAVATRLGLSLTEVQQRTETHRLLAIDLEGANEYPAWQFDGAGVIAGLEQVLEALAGLSAVLQVTFFLSSDERLGKERIEYLRTLGADRALLDQAQQVGKQGAA